MKLFVQQNVGGIQNGKWNWTIETDGGTVIAISTRYYETKKECVKEIKELQSSFGEKSISVRQPQQLMQQNIP